MISADWPGDVLTFWFEETQPEQWFKKDKDFDATIRRRFLALHEVLAAQPNEALFADARTALAAVIVFDQMSRNMFRDTPRAFATDPLAFWIAQAAIAKGFDTGLTKDERSFLYLPFEHAEDAVAQARCVALMATLRRSRAEQMGAGAQGDHRPLRALPASQRHPRPHLDGGGDRVPQGAGQLVLKRTDGALSYQRMSRLT